MRLKLKKYQRIMDKIKIIIIIYAFERLVHLSPSFDNSFPGVVKIISVRLSLRATCDN